jgi:aspartyl aminopeptidase
MSEKINYKKLEEKLISKKRNCWEVWDEKIKKEVFNFAEEYKQFLNQSKTEREAVKTGIILAEAQGFKNIEKIKSLKTGDKVYYSQRGKSLLLARIGKKKLTEGFRLVMSHIDSPHLDLKVHPLYEDESLAFFKTHYYGGIKKYQWPTISLALHGIVYLENGKEIEVVIGEKESEPIFMITDLLPHLDRPSGPGSDIKNREVKGEDLNLLVGSMPVKDEKIKEKVKLAILEYLFKKYGIKEDDFVSAELQVVPSEKARDLGFDRSLISAYGHDDKICSFAGVKSLFEANNSDYSQICAWVDREEIGSEGETGAKSIFFDEFLLRLLELSGENGNLKNVYKTYGNSLAISADVTAGVDPDYKDVHDLRNAARLGYGVAIEKYSGSGGKYSTSEASGKFTRKLMSAFSGNKDVVCQFCGGLGKVDLGGGGTIAKYIANRNIEIVDMGVPLLNMHAPLEIASKSDLFSAFLAYKAFFEK